MPVMPGAEAYAREGGPTGVLLCHGFTGSPQSLRPWAEYLAKAGLSVSLPRLPGHGTTWQEMARTRWEDWFAEVDRAFDELQAGLTRSSSWACPWAAAWRCGWPSFEARRSEGSSWSTRQ